MEFIGVGAAAFWIALAAVLIAASFNKVRREQVKQETLLKLIERTGQLDEAQVKLLFPQPPPYSNERPWWAAPPDPFAGRRALRIGGLILMALAAGLAVLSFALTFGTANQQAVAMPWFGVAGLVGCLGIGLFASSWFALSPVRRDEQQ